MIYMVYPTFKPQRKINEHFKPVWVSIDSSLESLYVTLYFSVCVYISLSQRYAFLVYVSFWSAVRPWNHKWVLHSIPWHT